MDSTSGPRGGLLDRSRIIANPDFNRWLVPPAALAIHLCIGMAYGFSVFWLPLSHALAGGKPVACPAGSGLADALFATGCDWSVADLNWIFTLFIFFLGVAAALCAHAELRAMLESLQQQLFDLGADLATPLGSKNASKVRRFTTDDAAALEPQIDAVAARLPPLKTFVLPGGSVLAAQLHVARTVCRRAERHLVELMEREQIGAGPLVYLNRLSDLLFMLARLGNQLEGTPDVAWQMRKPAEPRSQ